MRILKATEVANIVSLSVSQIWRLTRQGEFPSPIKLTTCRSGWLEAEVFEWVSQRIAGRAGAGDQSDVDANSRSGE